MTPELAAILYKYGTSLTRGLDDAAFQAKRITSPWLAAKTDEIAAKGIPLAAQNAIEFGDDATEAALPMFKWAEAKTPSTSSFLSDVARSIHSPDMVSNNPAWQAIVKEGMEGDLDVARFYSARHPAYIKAKGAMRRDAVDDVNLWEALEGKFAPEQLSAKAKPLYDVMKKDYYLTFHDRLQQLAGSDDGYRQLMTWSKEGITPAEELALAPNMKEAWDLAQREIPNYVHHFRDRNETVTLLSKRLNELTSNLKQTQDPAKLKSIGAKIAEYEQSLVRLQGGEPILWERLPGDFTAPFELPRKGGFEAKKSAIRSYENYLHAYARKVYEEPRWQRMRELYYELPYELRPYAKGYIRRWAGYEETTWATKAASTIANFEYLRTLGLNMRSPITNLTQQFNTVVDAGPKHAMKGYLRVFTNEAEKIWKKTGLGQEIPAVLTEDLGPQATKFEKLKRIAGYMFNRMEMFNRKHALMTYLSKYEETGLPHEEALRKAIDGVYKTQFKYGRTGMPQILSNPVGRVALQYFSYPIKQVEFLQKLARENPLKLASWIGGSYGINRTFADVLGLDISNALGFGMNLDEAIETVKSASQGEVEEAWAHGKLTFAQGSGLLPSGPGPFVSSLMDISKAVSKGEKITPTLISAVMPTQAARVEVLLEAIKKRHLATEEGKVPVINPATQEFRFEETPGELAFQTFGPKLMSRTKKELTYHEQQLMDQMDSKRKRAIAEAILEGKEDKADKMIEKWGITPTRDYIYELMLQRTLPRDLRKKHIQAQARQDARVEAKK